ncbi:FliH/SctL family protein [Paenibacillus sp. 481]|uniref:FliH/SctL family protein n=1 Tax=Paenibacillus sp. 481 TaxID=2835869 RepID=UPI001E586635|nr:FliH/SctL family protein [Paenibacillus sp. 481]UHA73938.1 flagellar assembly protein FliH [Paenibacillus sp. 481]
MSNLIKSSQYIPVEQMRLLEAVRKHQEQLALEEQQSEPLTKQKVLSQDRELADLRQSILDDAQAFAEQHVSSASEEAEYILTEAREQIEAWWREQREQDEALVEQLKREGYEQGYADGTLQAEETIREAYELKMAEAQTVLQQAYLAKDQLIQEAEPFVVTVSCAIAERIIDKHLATNEEAVLDMVRKALARKRESGTITLCVSPKQFSFIHAAREELSVAIDSQAELQIIPDASVNDHGCVVRSALGSIDARIDTQLSEIKKALLQVALHHGEKDVHEG